MNWIKGFAVVTCLGAPLSKIEATTRVAETQDASMIRLPPQPRASSASETEDADDDLAA